MLQVLLTFPGTMSLEEFSGHVSTLKGLGCELQLNDSIAKESAPIKAKKAASAKIEVITAKDRLTKNEEKILDQGLAAIHRNGTSPLLDAMTAKGVGKLRPNMSQEIVAYYKANPGHTTAMGASALAEKHIAHYQDVNDAFKKIRNLINTMAYAKGAQKSLEKRGGFAGRGGDAQVFALDGA